MNKYTFLTGHIKNLAKNTFMQLNNTKCIKSTCKRTAVAARSAIGGGSMVHRLTST